MALKFENFYKTEFQKVNIERIQMKIHLNSQKPIKSVCRNAFLRNAD